MAQAWIWHLDQLGVRSREGEVAWALDAAARYRAGVENRNDGFADASRNALRMGPDFRMPPDGSSAEAATR